MANLNTSEVAMKIRAMLEEGQPRFSEECCIYRVPHEIRKHNEEAYTPRVVSIGPFHHGNEKLLNMERQKRLYCRQFIERSETKNLETFVSCVQEVEAEVRGCYSEDIKLSKEELVMLILVDCCFILQFLLELVSMATGGDPLFLPRRLMSSICIDLFLLENQVPFFVLEKLFNLAFPSTLTSGIPSHILLSLPAVAILPDKTITYDNLEQTITNIGRVAHFTDLSRKLLLISSQLFQPSSASGCSREAKVIHLYSATKLNELGVKFKLNKESNCLLDLELSRHSLGIPFITVDDKTELFLRNLLAFEQCHCVREGYLTDYITVLDFLINTDNDVDLLIKEGIIENWLGDSNAVSKMFNGLGVNILNSGFNEKYSLIFESLNAFCANCYVKKFATLKRDYCNTAWQAAATFAAIFLLILTVIQTVFSVLQGIH